MSISVVIPTYDGSRFIRETLASVFAQTRLPEEVIVVDDASTDNTPKIVKEIAATSAAPLRLIELKRNSGGPAVPMNVGIEAARSDCITLLDHDDLMQPDKLATQAAVLTECPDVDLVLSDYDTLRGEQVEYDPKPWPWSDRDAGCDRANASARDSTAHELATREIVSAGKHCRVFVVESVTCTRMFLRSPGLPCSCSNLFFRKKLWVRMRGFDHRAGPCADYDFVMRAAGKPVAWIDARLFRKRAHETNLWQSTAQNRLKTLRAQRRCVDGRDATGDLRRGVAIRGSTLARQLRAERRYAASLRAAMEILLLGCPARAAAEACKTLFTLPGYFPGGATRAARLAERGPASRRGG